MIWNDVSTNTVKIQLSDALAAELNQLRRAVEDLKAAFTTCMCCGDHGGEVMGLCHLCREAVKDARKNLLAEYAKMMMEEIA